MKEENTNHYRMGQFYNYVVDKKLAEKANFKDAKDYFTKHLADLSQTSLTLYGAVANDFSEPVARRFGVICLYLLLTYKEAADIEVNHEEPGDTLIEVPDDKGHVTAKPFGDCSVDQMRRALKRLRKPASSKPLTPEAEALAEQYSEAVTGSFPKGTRVKVNVCHCGSAPCARGCPPPRTSPGALSKRRLPELSPPAAVSRSWPKFSAIAPGPISRPTLFASPARTPHSSVIRKA